MFYGLGCVYTRIALRCYINSHRYGLIVRVNTMELLNKYKYDYRIDCSFGKRLHGTFGCAVSPSVWMWRLVFIDWHHWRWMLAQVRPFCIYLYQSDNAAALYLQLTNSVFWECCWSCGLFFGCSCNLLLNNNIIWKWLVLFDMTIIFLYMPNRIILITHATFSHKRMTVNWQFISAESDKIFPYNTASRQCRTIPANAISMPAANLPWVLRYDWNWFLIEQSCIHVHCSVMLALHIRMLICKN